MPHAILTDLSVTLAGSCSTFFFSIHLLKTTMASVRCNCQIVVTMEFISFLYITVLTVACITVLSITAVCMIAATFSAHLHARQFKSTAIKVQAQLITRFICSFLSSPVD